jgi:hypothetical protein
MYIQFLKNFPDLFFKFTQSFACFLSTVMPFTEPIQTLETESSHFDLERSLKAAHDPGNMISRQALAQKCIAKNII